MDGAGTAAVLETTEPGTRAVPVAAVTLRWWRLCCEGVTEEYTTEGACRASAYRSGRYSGCNLLPAEEALVLIDSGRCDKACEAAARDLPGTGSGSDSREYKWLFGTCWGKAVTGGGTTVSGYLLSPLLPCAAYLLYP